RRGRLRGGAGAADPGGGRGPGAAAGPGRTALPVDAVPRARSRGRGPAGARTAAVRVPRPSSKPGRAAVLRVLHVELVGDRAQQAGDLLAGGTVGVAAALQLRGDVLQQGGQVLDDGGQFVRLAALRRRDRRGGVEHRQGEGLVTALSGDHAELHALARLECLDSGGEDRGMDEDVTAVVSGEKAEALLTVEPLDLAGRHVCPRPCTRRENCSETALDSTGAGLVTRRYQG